MNERMKQLAEQAGLLPLWVCVNESTGSQMIKPIDQDVIERFVELVRQDEREACAKVCDDLDDVIMYELAGWQYGDAIRGRTE
jgi:hypothetical protein